MAVSLYERVNEEIDIVSLVSEFVKLEKQGKNYMGLCPFHQEKSPSFSVSPDKKIAKCMACGGGGRAVTFYSQIKNIPPSEAVTELAKRFGIETNLFQERKDRNEKYYPLLDEASNFYSFALKNTELGHQMIDHLNTRGLNDELIDHFEIGLAPNQMDALYQLLRSKNYSVSDMIDLGLVNQGKDGSYYDVFRNRIIFPIKNERGFIVGFSGRSIDKNERAKYINSKETVTFKKSETLYHLSDARGHVINQKHVILHEGFFDVIASFKAGFKASVATMGTSLTNEQASLIKRITTHVIIAYDGDNAGLNATLKSIPILRSVGLKISVLLIPNKLDPDDYINKEGINKYQNLIENNLLDSYLFTYELLSKNKDFKKADDITVFKREFLKVIHNADISVINFYENKFLKDFGINLFLSKTPSPIPQKEGFIYHKIVNRAERTIDKVIVNLLLGNVHSKHIINNLDVSMLITKEQKLVYREIADYLELIEYNQINLNHFLENYTKDKTLYNKYITDVDYINNLPIKSIDELNKKLSDINNYKLQLEIEEYKEKLKEINSEDLKNLNLKKLLKKQRQKKKLKN
ncbi:MAG: DNA primase [Acholeplasmataceae bacterium]